MKMWDSNQLWLKAKALVDRANDIDHSSPDFPFWSALALELLARAALTHIHPVLNADPRDDSNILYGCGFEVAKQPRSLPVHAVYLRLEKTLPDFGKTHRELCDFLGILRNQELHTAELPFDNLKESKWLPRFYEVSSILCKSMGHTLEEFLSDEVGGAARKLIQTLVEGIEGTVKKQIAEHRRDFEALPSTEQDRLRAQADAALRLLKKGTTRESCPACEIPGKLDGDPVKELPPVYTEEGLIVDQLYLATKFECMGCGLSLRNLEEIRSADMEFHFMQSVHISFHELHEPDFEQEYDNM